MVTRTKADSSRVGGGKLSRSETVTVRLDPKLNYLCELAARAQRRTKSSFIEWAVAEALSAVTVPDLYEFDGDTEEFKSVTIRDKSRDLWHVDEADRLVTLALNAPSLLNHDEQIVWKYIRENGSFWKGNFDKSSGEWTWKPSLNSAVLDRIRDRWPTILRVVYEDLDPNSLPTWKKYRDDVDDDIPF